ncbi:hypothetical protein CAP31_06010 [Sulfuriferula sp. AH1]|uniref:phage holin family protein n=1 Tax=Sulfuriferula sp. AH1 TaxID=1985873 RepID=UPI000B3B0BF1|nr:phage holin family protein [Sulfuriferula sp. AH1]ARU31279.1 hypothetical protein CAP31_06010 [Sulfuriferula sp. AH1]
MNEGMHADSKGLFESFKVLAASLIAITHTRLDLLSTDVEEDRDRLIAILVLLLIALFCFGLGIVLLAVLIAVAFQDSYQLLILSGLTGIFLLAGAAIIGFMLQRRKAKPRLFAASLAELAKDVQQLRQRP